jgi:hypothetical protein
VKTIQESRNLKLTVEIPLSQRISCKAYPTMVLDPEKFAVEFVKFVEFLKSLKFLQVIETLKSLKFLETLVAMILKGTGFIKV